MQNAQKPIYKKRFDSKLIRTGPNSLTLRDLHKRWPTSTKWTWWIKPNIAPSGHSPSPKSRMVWPSPKPRMVWPHQISTSLISKRSANHSKWIIPKRIQITVSHTKWILKIRQWSWVGPGSRSSWDPSSLSSPGEWLVVWIHIPHTIWDQKRAFLRLWVNFFQNWFLHFFVDMQYCYF